MNEIAKTDSKQLTKLEKRIEANTKAAWRENGLIMLHIRNTGLYKAGIGKPEFDEYGKVIPWTFERYLEKRWDCGRSTGYQMLAAAEFVQKLAYCAEKTGSDLSAMADKKAPILPENERQIRPLLTCLNPIPFNGVQKWHPRKACWVVERIDVQFFF